MKLTSENVHAMIRKCLPEAVTPEDEVKLRKGEEVPGYVLVKGASMARCHHPQENVRARDFNKEKCWVDAYCDNCGQGWLGYGYPWRSSSGKLHKPPAWVLRLIKFKETVSA